MKLEKAIEIVELYIPDPDFVSVLDSCEAFQLLIEAGKRIKWYRGKYLGSMNELLPGETVE